jgi:glycopeptide antibiotics resistance protein
VESLQFVLNNGRSVDIDDVLLNGLGTFLGAAAMSLILRASHRPEASKPDLPTLVSHMCATAGW